MKNVQHGIHGTCVTCKYWNEEDYPCNECGVSRWEPIPPAPEPGSMQDIADKLESMLADLRERGLAK